MQNNEKLNDLTNSLGFNLINTSISIKDELRKRFIAEGYDVTPDQFAVLIKLWKKDGVSQKELCDKTLKTKSNITRILDSMEKRDLLSRQVNKEDRRIFNIYLTNKGKNLRTILLPIAISTHQKIFQNLSDNDKKNLQKILEMISINLG